MEAVKRYRVNNRGAREPIGPVDAGGFTACHDGL